MGILQKVKRFGPVPKVSEELAKILREAAKEVDKWPAWKRSLDPFGPSLDCDVTKPPIPKPPQGGRF